MDPSSPPPAEKARLERVAALMLDIYKTLAEMQYLDEEDIQAGPHDIQDLLPVYKEHGLDSSIVYLYSILPYVDTSVVGDSDFFQGGGFADFRNPEDVEQGRDPFYCSPEGDDFDDENGPYIRPWVTPLSLLGNHQSVIIYDARKHRIWIIDQEGWESTDLALSEVEKGTALSANRNAFEHIPSRPAEDVLRDIKSWYRTLKLLPGGEHSGDEWSECDLDLRGLYRGAGWPDNFDREAFGISQARAAAAATAKYNAEEPVRQVKNLKSSAQYSKENIQRRLREIAEAKNKDEEWIARFNLWKGERWIKSDAEKKTEIEETAARLCPGGVCQKPEDLPLWEAEMLRHELKWKQESAEANRNWTEQSKDDGDRAARFRTEQRREEKEVAVYQKAYDASRADADRLCPGRTFESATGIKSLGRRDTLTMIQMQTKSIAFLERNLDELREWAAQIPEDATKAREHLDFELKQFEESIDGAKEMKKGHEDWLEKHGNSD